jgi:ADP-heptose:LPS heptosyltransferase
VPGRHDVEHNLDLALRLGADRARTLASGVSTLRQAEKFDDAAADRWLGEHGLQHQKLIGIAPGGGRRQAFKRWPLERYVRLVVRWREIRPEHGVLWFLGPDESALRERLVTQAGAVGGFAIVEGVPIATVVALLRRCQAVVANDNGLMHMANIQRVPVVGVFGPTDSRRTRPYWQPHAVVHVDLPCRPCYSAARRRFRCTNPQGMACLLTLGEEAVLDALHALTAGGA